LIGATRVYFWGNRMENCCGRDQRGASGISPALPCWSSAYLNPCRSQAGAFGARRCDVLVFTPPLDHELPLAAGFDPPHAEPSSSLWKVTRSTTPARASIGVLAFDACYIRPYEVSLLWGRGRTTSQTRFPDSAETFPDGAI